MTVNSRGILEFTTRVETGDIALGTTIEKKGFKFLTTKNNVYLVKLYFSYKNSLSSREVKIVGREDPNCAMFIHLGGGLYETMQAGTITCYDKKIKTFSISVRDTFSSKLNQNCNSSCVTTNTGNIKTEKVKIDPLPAPHATLVRGLDEDIGTVMDGKSGGMAMNRTN